ncbi:MAG: NADH dehydrogenase [Nitrososphaerota archaeon]|nr:NADH dehydrogenase [Nitrososphaerota archaeon]MDG7041427.1 NADH dehydrogenase [Nitrososphaerota archaeon]
MTVTALPLGLSVLLVPFVVSVLLLAIGGRVRPRLLAYISAASLGVPLVFTSAVMALYRSYSATLLAVGGLGSFMVVINGLNWPVLLGIMAVTMAIAIYSVPYMKRRFEELGKEHWGTYFFLYTFFSASMVGIVESNNFIMFYLFLELSLISSFLLIAFYGYGDRGRVSFIYLIWTHLGAFLFLLGGFIYGMILGTFNFYPVPPNLSSIFPYVYVVIALILLGLFIKMAIFGVHVWLPYAHAEAPTPISALLSPALIGIGGYAIIRIPYILFFSYMIKLQWALIVLALVTIIYSGLLTFHQKDLKRLLAYSSIAQMGYMLLGIASFNPLGIVGAILQFYAHAVGKSLLFSSSGAIITENNGLRDITKMGGMAKEMPMTTSMAMLGFMDISGLPPTVGFFSKLFILLGVGSFLVNSGVYGFIMLIFLVVGFGITPAYSFTAMKRVFFGPSRKGFKDASLMMLAPLIFIAILGIITFIFPGLLIAPLYLYVHSLTGG